MIRYTKAEESWLRRNYRKGTINDTVDAFEEAFGRRPSKQALFVKANNMGLHKDKHGEERRHKAQKTMRWSSKEFERERNWMLENDKGESVVVRLTHLKSAHLCSTAKTYRREKIEKIPIQVFTDFFAGLAAFVKVTFPLFSCKHRSTSLINFYK